MVRESSDEELSAQVDEQADLLGPKITQRTIRCWLTNKKFYLVSPGLNLKILCVSGCSYSTCSFTDIKYPLYHRQVETRNLAVELSS